MDLRAIRPSIALLLLIVTVTANCRGPSQGQMQLRNQTNANIERIEISVCKRSLVLEGLGVGQEKMISFVVDCEGHFTIDLIRSDGMTYTHNVGYVTPGLENSYILTLLPEGHFEWEIDL